MPRPVALEHPRPRHTPAGGVRAHPAPPAGDSSCWGPHTAARARVGVGEDKGLPLLSQETGREQVLWAQRRLWDGF